MEPRFTTTSVYTYDEYKRFNWSLSGKKQLIAFSIFTLLLLICSILLESNVIFAEAVIFPLAMFLIYRISVKSMYKSAKASDNIEVTFEFFDTYFTDTNKYGVQKIEYELLHKIFFTKTNVYLFLSKRQAYMLIKKNFPEGLEDFLKSVAPAKKKKKS